MRDIIRRTDLATGTFYNYFPDKESVLREILDETTGEIRVRVRAARRGAHDASRSSSPTASAPTSSTWRAIARRSSS